MIVVFGVAKFFHEYNKYIKDYYGVYSHIFHIVCCCGYSICSEIFKDRFFRHIMKKVGKIPRASKVLKCILTISLFIVFYEH